MDDGVQPYWLTVVENPVPRHSLQKTVMFLNSIVVYPTSAMKTIHLLRHAKSSWADPELEDRDRPLNNRGKRSVVLMIEPLWKAGCRFENVYTSPAKRARSTIKKMAKALKGEGIHWHTDEALYTFEAGDLLAWLQQRSDALEDVMLVGHNPAITDLANRLGDETIDKVPTCGYVQLQTEVTTWSELGPDCASTVKFLYPKLFDFDD